MALLVGELKAALNLDTSKYDQGLDRSHARFSKFVKTAAIASAAVAVAAGAGLLKLAKGAAEDEAAQKVLATTLKNTAGATDAQVASIERYISKTGAATGVMDDEMRPALANLVRATHDVGQAQSLMGIAMDVSAGTGRDLGAVSLALAKAQNGNVGGLAKLGIATKDAAGHTKSFEQIQKDLAVTFKGQAAAAADTLEGKYKRSTLTLSEMGETIGAKALPVLAVLANVVLTDVFPALGKMGAALSSVAGFVKRNQTTFKVFAVVIGLVAAATAAHTLALAINSGALKAWFLQTKIVQVATKAWAAVQWVLNAALSANPIGIVIAAVAVLVVGLVYAYKHSEKFRAIVTGAFNAVKTVVLGAVGAIVSFFRDNWKRLPLLLLGPIGIVLFIFKGLPGKIVTALGNLGRLLLQAGKDLVAGLKNGITSIARTIGRWTYDHIISPTVAPFINAGTWLRQAGKNVIAGFWNGLKEIWTKVTAWISGIATWIKDHKGPVSLDGRLLVPAGRAIMSGFLKGLKSGAGPAWDFVQSVGGKSIAALRATLGAVGGLLSGAGANIGQNAALGKIMATAYGWTGAQWDALYTLWQHESGWNNNAQNPTSTAYGIAQFLNSTWGSVGASKTSDPAGQIAAGLRYIAMAYGSPANAWSKWQSRSPHWYAKCTPWVPND